jgi:hypothetical protein
MLQPLHHRQLRSTNDERRAAAREVLSEMKGYQGWIAEVDDSSLDFLATGISEQIMLEMARTWTVRGMGYPTSTKLAALSESVLLQAAVAALDS